jgi:preprotein translocase subunit YajC
MFSIALLVQDAAKDAATPGFPWPLLLGFAAIFYFMMIRPQMKEQKRRREMLGGLKKNDKVMTSGGMIGTIVAIDDNEVTLKVDDSNNVRIRFLRSAIAGPVPTAAAEPAAEPSTK